MEVARAACTLGVAMLVAIGGDARAQSTASTSDWTVVGDAIPASLTGVPGDAVRGRAIVVSRQTGLCLLCHPGPFAEERFQGNLAPDLSGAGMRWTAGQLRLRLVDPRRIHPATIMPSYRRTDGLERVVPDRQGRPILGPQDIEDVVALLVTLRD